MRIDVFCRVVDNYGDIGVCWRLAADLAGRGHALRLWVDDPAPLQWMAPGLGDPSLQVLHWREPLPAVDPGDLVIEAFGCNPPPDFVAAMVAQPRPPVWINLEYLSAEAWIERSHGLPSPQASGPGAGLAKWFYFPGFTARSGGLIREPGLLAERAAFDRDAWLQQHGWGRRADEQVLVLFCYDGAPVAGLLAALRDAPTLLLATPGLAARACAQWRPAAGPGTRIVELPWLAQAEFDRLLWCADLNFVRGEDSFVRAQWAGAPFVWQIYPQHDAVHGGKLQAFLDRFLQGADAGLARPLTGLWRAWNGLAPWSRPDCPPLPAWRARAQAWRDALAGQDDLVTQLLRFVEAHPSRDKP